MGVSGCGKSTVAALLAAELGWDVAEGDAMHPAANVAKMASGHPLDDEDRRPWLEQVAVWIQQHADARRPGIIACSALKRAYRDRLRRTQVIFVYLHGTREQIAARLTHRRGHYMPVTLLDSQFAALEPPGPDENALWVDITPTPAEQVAGILGALELTGLTGSDPRGEASG
jgi:carbohydrate kinase (thermoresistant glucokinase family)